MLLNLISYLAYKLNFTLNTYVEQKWVYIESGTLSSFIYLPGVLALCGQRETTHCILEYYLTTVIKWF